MFLNDTKTPASDDITLDERAEEVLFGVAQSLGLLVTEDEAQAFAHVTVATEAAAGSSPEALNEFQSIVRLNRQAKLDGLTVRAALVIAQQKNDPLFAKYAKAAALKRQFRQILMRKYGTAAGTTARRLLASAGKRNLVDVAGAASQNREKR